MEDWAAIAAEVDEAIKSVASTDEGYPATIRSQSSTGGDPWEPTTSTAYTTIRVIEEDRRVRSADGTYVDMVKRTLTTASKAGFVPKKSDEIAVGITASEASDSSDWLVITEVRALAPAGVAVLYEIELST
jgi:hypothetical protein